ncbi:MAG: filamentous hemagglutinin N-terminal domain-containing protein, partial [Scytonema sp. PMC 1069.18]|nr:filamentous hemagglutinin N-terminal domain-containing protein [Scytonema sp. PMC 1069.18]
MGATGTRWGWLFGIAISGAYTVSTNYVNAQVPPPITPDNTLPINSSVRLEDNNTTVIEAGTTRGTNLFHSFQNFSVPDGSTAFFNNALDIQNIISRVTGSSISNIEGLIRANGAANLFLMNPNGIIFGPNAQLNVGGSFVATTANAIQFGNQGFFSASNPEAPSPLLTINPSALLYNQITASIQNGSIAPAGLTPSGQNSSGLRVADGKSLLLVGGDINMDGGRLNAYGGRVELGGLGSPGTVGLQVDGNYLSLDFPENIARGSVFLTNGANIDVSAAGGGSIAVNARNIELSGGSQLTAGIGQGLGSVDAVAGDITLNATGEIKVVGSSSVINNVNQQAVGKGGNINVTTGSLSLTDGAQLVASTYGQGHAGNVLINANDVAFAGLNGTITSGVQSNVESGGVGNGGSLNINAAKLSLSDGAQVQTIVREAFNNQAGGRGNAGDVNVNITGAITIAGVRNGFPSGIFSALGNGAEGKGGNINVTTGSLFLTDGAQLVASTYGQGNAGNVLINANDVAFAGLNGTITSGVQSNVESGGVGNGGSLNINAAKLSLSDGAQVQTIVREAFNNQLAGRGNAGNIDINVTGAVTIAGVRNGFSSGILSYLGNGAEGKGGNINVTTGSLSLSDGAQINASTLGEGNAGNIEIQVSESLIAKGGAVLRSDSFGEGNAGNIAIEAGDGISLDGVSANGTSSGIFSFIGNDPQFGLIGKGTGGDINIIAKSLSLSNGAQINASTLGEGNAGNI